MLSGQQCSCSNSLSALVTFFTEVNTHFKLSSYAFSFAPQFCFVGCFNENYYVMLWWLCYSSAVKCTTRKVVMLTVLVYVHTNNIRLPLQMQHKCRGQRTHCCLSIGYTTITPAHNISVNNVHNMPLCCKTTVHNEPITYCSMSVLTVIVSMHCNCF